MFARQFSADDLKLAHNTVIAPGTTARVQITPSLSNGVRP